MLHKSFVKSTKKHLQGWIQTEICGGVYLSNGGVDFGQYFITYCLGSFLIDVC